MPDIHTAKNNSKKTLIALIIMYSSAVNASEFRSFFSLQETSRDIESGLESLYAGKLSIESAYINKQGSIIKPKYYTVDYPPEGVTLGQGWDVEKVNKTMSSCIAFDTSDAGGQNVTVSYINIISSDQLKREINTSLHASASGSFGPFSAKASGKSNLIRKSNIESSFETNLLKATVIDGIEFVAPKEGEDSEKILKLSKFAESILKKNNLSSFREHCGDAFVSGIQRGSELYLLSKKNTYSAFLSKQKNKSFSASGSYFGFSAGGGGSTNSLEESLTKDTNSSFDYTHSAHRGVFIPADIKEISQTLRLLGDSTKDNKSFPFRVQLTRYTEIPGYNDMLDNLKTPIVDRIQVYLERLESIQSKLNHMLDYTLLDKTGGKKDGVPCSLGNPTSCVKYDNLEIYYIGDKENGDWDLPKARVYYTSILTAIEKEIIKTKNTITNCLSGDESNENCIARHDGKYNDYFYLALLPLSKNEQRFILENHALSIESLKKEIISLREEYKSKHVSTYRAAKKCPLGIGRGGPCGYKNIKKYCPDLPKAEPCIKIENRIRNHSAKVISLEKQTVYMNLAAVRFHHYIEERTKIRMQSGDIDNILSYREKEYLLTDIICQYNSAYEPCSNHESIYKIVVQGNASPKFSYKFNKEKHIARLTGYFEALISEGYDTKKSILEIVEENKGISEPDKSKFNELASLQYSNDEVITKSQIEKFNQLKHFEAEISKIISRNSFKLKFSNDIKEFEKSELSFKLESLKDWVSIGNSLSEYTKLMFGQSSKLSNQLKNDLLYKIYNPNTDSLIQSSKMFHSALTETGSNLNYITPEFPLYSLEEDFDIYVSNY